MLAPEGQAAAWPSGANIFFEMAGDYCNMVKEMSGGTLTIDLQPVGSVVKTSEIGAAAPISEVFTTEPTG